MSRATEFARDAKVAAEAAKSFADAANLASTAMKGFVDNTAKLTPAARQATDSMKGLEAVLGAVKAAVNAVAAATVVLGAALGALKLGTIFVDGIKGAIEFGDEMYHAGQVARIQAGDLLLFQTALEKTGYGAQEARDKIKTYLEEGRNIKDLFASDGDYFKALGMASQALGSQVDDLNRGAESFAMIVDAVNDVTIHIRGFFLAIATEVAPIIQKLATAVGSLDLSEWAKTIGSVLRQVGEVIIGLFTNGDFFSAIKSAFEVATQYLTNLLQAVANAFSAALFAGFIYMAPQIEKMMTNIGASVSNSLVDQLVKRIPMLQQFTGGGGENAPKPVKPSDGVNFDPKQLARVTGNAAKGQFNSTMNFMQPNVDEPMKGLMDILAKAKAAGAAALSGLGTPPKNNQSAREGMPEWSIIADSLAKVGGGGRSVAVGMSLKERDEMLNQRARTDNTNAVKELNTTLKSAKNAPVAKGLQFMVMG